MTRNQDAVAIHTMQRTIADMEVEREGLQNRIAELERLSRSVKGTPLKMNFMERRDCASRGYHDPHFYPQKEQPLLANGLKRWYFCTGSVR